eukprot:6666332-Lingulodinium_polyedra.AAC.1
MNRGSATTRSGIGESAWSVKYRSGLQSSPTGLKKRRRKTQTMQRSGRSRRISKWRTKESLHRHELAHTTSKERDP